MRILRTDDDHFAGLPDYNFEPNFQNVGKTGNGEQPLRLHYTDEGSPQAPTVIMLHGELGWSYLYRHMIPPVVAAGFRVLAPDLIGFGRSDKPAEQHAYSFTAHLNWLQAWLDAVDPQDVTLVCQNRSSLLGLALVARQPHRFSRIITANALIPADNHPESPLSLVWRGFARYSPWFPVARLMQLGTTRALTRAELAAYDAPFPDDDYKAGARSFARALCLQGDDVRNQRLWRFLETWNKPFVTCFSDSDPATRGADRPLQRRVPGAHGQPHITVHGGHFLQEDAPDAFVRVILDAMLAARAA